MTSRPTEFSVLGPLMGGFGSQAFLGCVHVGDGAIKPAVMVFLPDEIVENADLFKKVWQETQLGQEIDHINVIGVMGLARLDEGYARVVEYADAESLRSVFRRCTTLKRPISPEIATALVIDACMGVHYAHELGLTETGDPMIHGGIRPETVQLSFQGMAKVTGYGATTIAEVARKARGGDQKDAYTAPEQAYGGRQAATMQTDVYALGCVLYEALTGKAPFSADNDLAEAMIRDELSKPSPHSGEGFSPAMAQIVLTALAKKSDERYRTALEMRHDLLEICEHAGEGEIKKFMNELFPADTVPRATRDQMLAAARAEPPEPTGRLLTEFPLDVLKPSRRLSVPSDDEVEAAQGTRVEVTPVMQKSPRRSSQPSGAAQVSEEGQPLVEDSGVAKRLVERAVERAAERGVDDPTSPSGMSARAVDPPGAATPRSEPTSLVRPRTNSGAGAGTATRPPAASTPPSPPPSSSPPAPAAAPAQPKAAPSWQQNPTAPPRSAYPPEYPPSTPPVVYKTPPGLLIGFGLFAGVAVALLAVIALKDDDKPAPPPQPVVVQVPAPPPPPPPPPPVEPKKDEPKVEPKVDKKTGKKTGKSGGGEKVTTTTDDAPKKASLTFDNLPDGIEVVIDGKRIGTTPMGAIELAPIKHTAKLKRADGKEAVIGFQIPAGVQGFLQPSFP